MEGLNKRHRNKDGEISRKHGNTKIRTLRRIYGSHFAPKADDSETLRDVLDYLDEISLSQLVHHHENGQLSKRIQEAEKELH